MNEERDDDAELVAFVHDELSAPERQRVLARLRSDGGARSRLRLLTAVDDAVADALQRPQPRGRAVWPRYAAAAAAVLVVAVVMSDPWPQGRKSAQDPGAHGFVDVEATPSRASVPLFTDVKLVLHWRGRGDADARWRLQFLPFSFDRDLAAMGREFAANNQETLGKFTPVVVSATIQAPDGTRHPARLRPPQTFPLTPDADMRQTVELRDFEWQAPRSWPLLAGAPGDGEWRDDFQWAFRELPVAEVPRWLPDEPGTWTVELRVDSVPPPTPGAWPEFKAPALATAQLQFTGIASAWSEPSDGMRARMLLGTGAVDVDRTPVALQLRNESGRVRTYNVTGRTQAPIPQPLHFALVVDGVDWPQRRQLDVITPATSLEFPHADGALRTLIARLEYWRLGERRLQELVGSHRLQMRLHFRPWLREDRPDDPLWQGNVLTPPVEFEVTAPK